MSENLAIFARFRDGSCFNQTSKGKKGFYFNSLLLLLSFLIIGFNILFPFTAAGALLLSKVLILSFAMPSYRLYSKISHVNTKNIITVTRVNALALTFERV